MDWAPKEKVLGTAKTRFQVDALLGHATNEIRFKALKDVQLYQKTQNEMQNAYLFFISLTEQKLFSDSTRAQLSLAGANRIACDQRPANVNVVCYLFI